MRVRVCGAGGAEDDHLPLRHAGIITHKTSGEMVFTRFKKRSAVGGGVFAKFN